uniref:Saccharopine dehydrogenase n=1 Tax=Cyanothece sp. (strain PCC 7425 / ATCC 29141) TaxID=395961 RepID=B8HPK4_CYAP4
MVRVLIVGGTGRIGCSVARDLLAHTSVEITLSGRNQLLGQQIAAGLGDRVRFLALDLSEQEALRRTIASVQLVIHCAGPFHYRDARVLNFCIQEGVNYLDVSDHRSFTVKALEYQEVARQAGVTAIVNTGIFPGISNSMVRQDVEALDEVEEIHLSYVVAGSGGAGRTVMRTTFLGLLHVFQVWQQGQWQGVQPYTEREVVEFPPPYGKAPVYWFDMPEALTLPRAFPVKTVITKFGSLPDFYNHITWAIAHWLPKAWLQTPAVMDFLSWGGFTTTQFTDRFSGTGVAIRSQVTGLKNGQPAQASSTLALPDTAIAAGYGTGSLAQVLLDRQLVQPGVWTVEEVLPTALFQQLMQQRSVNFEHHLIPLKMIKTCTL